MITYAVWIRDCCKPLEYSVLLIYYSLTKLDKAATSSKLKNMAFKAMRIYYVVNEIWKAFWLDQTGKKSAYLPAQEH